MDLTSVIHRASERILWDCHFTAAQHVLRISSGWHSQHPLLLCSQVRNTYSYLGILLLVLSRALFVWLRLWSWFQIRPRPGSGSWYKVAFRMFFEDLKTTTTTVGNFFQPRLVKYYIEKEKELNKELCLRFAKYFKVFFTFVGWCQSESHLQISLPALLQNVQLIGYLYKTKL